MNVSLCYDAYCQNLILVVTEIKNKLRNLLDRFTTNHDDEFYQISWANDLQTNCLTNNNKGAIIL